MSENTLQCQICHGSGYLIKKHLRVECTGCGGKGTISKILGIPLTKSQQREATHKAKELSALAKRIDQVRQSIREKECEIDDLHGEISLLESDLKDLLEEQAEVA